MVSSGGCRLVLLCAIGGVLVAGSGPAAATCTEFGCVHLVDRDGDEIPDGVTAASGTEFTSVGAAGFTDGALWRIEVAGPETLEDYPVASFTGNLTVADSSGGPGFREVNGCASLVTVDHDTGLATPIVEACAHALDADADGVPDEVGAEASPLPG